MTIAIMQPYLFPYLGYWQLVNMVDTFVIFDDVNFIKKGYINRNSILVDGNAQLFTLELLKASQNKLINEIEVGDNREKILKTIEMAYKKAPYFDRVYPILEDIFGQKEKNLARFVGYSLEKISNYLQIDTQFIYSSDIEKNNNLKAQDKIIDLIQNLSADTYINPIGGKDLYNQTDFKVKDIKLKYIKTKFEEYSQFHNIFVPSLSIIDIMMFNDYAKIKFMLNNLYELED